MDQVWKGLSNLDPRDPGGFYKKPLLNLWLIALSSMPLSSRDFFFTGVFSVDEGSLVFLDLPILNMVNVITKKWKSCNFFYEKIRSPVKRRAQHRRAMLTSSFPHVFVLYYPICKQSDCVNSGAAMYLLCAPQLCILHFQSPATHHVML